MCCVFSSQSLQHIDNDDADAHFLFFYLNNNKLLIEWNWESQKKKRITLENDLSKMRPIFISTRRYSSSWSKVSSSMLDMWWIEQIRINSIKIDFVFLAQCSIPLTSWIRQAPLSGDYLCNSCHIKTYGLKEGLVVINWQKQNKSMVSTNQR